MSLSRKLVILMAGEAVAKAASLASLVITARYFQPELFGRFQFGLAFGAFFAIWAELGTSHVLTRRVAQDPANARGHLLAFIPIKVGLALLSIATFWLAFLSLSLSPGLALLLFLLCLYQVLQSLGEAFSAAFMGLERPGVRAVVGAIQAIGILFGVWVLAVAGAELVAFAALYVGMATLSLGMMVAFARRSLPGKEKVRRPRFGDIGPVAIGSAAISVYYYIDAIMVRLFHGDIESGFYQSAYRLFQVTLAAAFLFRLLMPMVSRLTASGDPAPLRALTQPTLRILTFIGLGGFAVSLAHHDFLIRLVYGVAYLPASGPLVILLGSTTFVYLGIAFGNQLIAQGQQRAWMLAVVAGALLNVVLNVAFIPRYGAIAAASTTLAADGFVAVATFLAIHPEWRPLDIAWAKGVGWFGLVSILANLLFARLLVDIWAVTLGAGAVLLLGLVMLPLRRRRTRGPTRS